MGRRIQLALAGALVTAKVTAVSIDPGSASTRVFPNLYLVALVLALVLSAARSQDKPRGKGFRRCVVLLGALALAFVVSVAWADHGLRARTVQEAPSASRKVWSTRGLVTTGPEILRDGLQNSIGSIALAFDHGARGVEVDVFYDVASERFVVSHDRPYNLKDGALLHLEELLDVLGRRGAIWLDWKKLRLLDEDELASSLERLAFVVDRHGDRERFYVEGADPFNLSAVRRAGFRTLYDTAPLPDAHFITPLLIDLYKLVFYFGDFSVIGMEGGSLAEPVYGPETRRALRNVPAFVYHVPDERQHLESLTGWPDVRVILLRDQSLDRFQFESGAIAPRPSSPLAQ